MNKPFVFSHSSKEVLDVVEYSILGRYGHIVSIAKSDKAIVVMSDALAPVKATSLRKELDILTKGILDTFRWQLEQASEVFKEVA